MFQFTPINPSWSADRLDIESQSPSPGEASSSSANVVDENDSLGIATSPMIAEPPVYPYDPVRDEPKANSEQSRSGLRYGANTGLQSTKALGRLQPSRISQSESGRSNPFSRITGRPVAPGWEHYDEQKTTTTTKTNRKGRLESIRELRSSPRLRDQVCILTRCGTAFTAGSTASLGTLQNLVAYAEGVRDRAKFCAGSFGEDTTRLVPVLTTTSTGKDLRLVFCPLYSVLKSGKEMRQYWAWRDAQLGKEGAAAARNKRLELSNSGIKGREEQRKAIATALEAHERANPAAVEEMRRVYGSVFDSEAEMPVDGKDGKDWEDGEEQEQGEEGGDAA